MAKLKLIHVWEQTSEYDDYTDYAAYLYSKNNQITGQLTIIENLALDDMAHIGYLTVPKFNVQDVKIAQLQQHIKSMVIDVESICEISCVQAHELHVVTDLVKCKKLRNQLNTLQKTLAAVYFEDYVHLDQAPIEDLKQQIETECMIRFPALSYQMIVSSGQYKRNVMIMPDDVQAILGDDMFKQLSEHHY